MSPEPVHSGRCFRKPYLSWREVELCRSAELWCEFPCSTGVIHRSLGSPTRKTRTVSLHSSGRELRISSSAAESKFITFSTARVSLGAWKGDAPPWSSANMTQPSDHKSVSNETESRPLKSSGLEYSDVPRGAAAVRHGDPVPVPRLVVRSDSVRHAFTSMADPKSHSWIRPPALSSKFSGLTSQWTTELVWMYSSACSVWYDRHAAIRTQ